MARSTRCLLHFVSATVALLAGGVGGAAAHDPGLSSTTIVVSADSLTATMRMHDADLASLDAASLSRVLSQDPEASPLVVRANGSEREATRIASRHDGDDETTIEMTFPRPIASLVEVDVALLASLPRGHKHHVEVRDGDGTVLATSILSAAASTLQVRLGPAVAATEARGTGAWFAVGVEHILHGYDHLLFVFALLLGAAGLRDSVRLITAFTVGHSVSLALAATGLVNAPPDVVEPAIAASVVVVALLALGGTAARRERTGVTFAFGLVHGLGFASALAGVGIDAGSPMRLLASLLAFNLGVEAGQLAFATVVLPLLALLRSTSGFSERGLRWCSAAVAGCGTFWFVQRVTVG